VNAGDATHPATSSNDKSGISVTSEHDAMREKLYRALTRVPPPDGEWDAWETMSSAQAWKGVKDINIHDPIYASVEGVHDDLHFHIGGTRDVNKGIVTNGTMSDQDMSAFDPLFWHLHSLIENWFCIWQVQGTAIYAAIFTNRTSVSTLITTGQVRKGSLPA
jgi:hypothetical protein